MAAYFERTNKAVSGDLSCKPSIIDESGKDGGDLEKFGHYGGVGTGMPLATPLNRDNHPNRIKCPFCSTHSYTRKVKLRYHIEKHHPEKIGSAEAAEVLFRKNASGHWKQLAELESQGKIMMDKATRVMTCLICSVNEKDRSFDKPCKMMRHMQTHS